MSGGLLLISLSNIFWNIKTVKNVVFFLDTIIIVSMTPLDDKVPQGSILYKIQSWN